MLLITALLGFIAVDLTFLKVPLLPSTETSQLQWRATAYSDAAEGGSSSIEIIDDDYTYSLNMVLREDKESPFAMGEMEFVDAQGTPITVDLRQFKALSFMAKCMPENTLTFSLFTLDEDVLNFDDARSDRISTRYFHCNKEWQQFDIDITHLDTPEWWYKWYEQQLSDQEYSLSKVIKISFGSSIQSPKNVQSNINIRSLSFLGRDWFYIYLFGSLCGAGWIVLLVWLIRQHASHLMADIREKMQKDRPLIAYKQLSIESHKDKDKTTILRLMATEYANPEVNLDYIVHTSGINRNKINEILKDELGYTFSAYLNKLRLHEAARLLSENNDSNVSEIAYTVGYKNVPYFNKLFKNEYGCSPKLFKSTSDHFHPEV
ncbi:helix-turn-helix domain-containing protein [Alteromonas gilva]|uniref:Helix-turn-helix domain-containing protein n=1 Tax=Alteromonas gilva TaxID=2987522 RepID=A0ABT5L069_9ALTE|nr:helix-turn-helix domain-containing protein [Alteromonas gilva]MDC8829208.1 helix-turn-helix domain-containing protein [Alteromonas gilva]